MGHEFLRFGLYNKHFQMNSAEVLEQKLVDIRNTPSLFEIKMGPMVMDEFDALKDTYVLEIHYRESEDRVASKLPLGGFNSYLCHKFGLQAHKLADDFIKKHNLILNNHLNSWPVYQSIVSEKPSTIDYKETKNKLRDNYYCRIKN